MTADPYAPRARLAGLGDRIGWSQQQRFTALQELTTLQRDSVLWHLCSSVPGAVERAYRVVTNEPDPGPVLPDPAGFLPDFYETLPGPDQSALQLDLSLGAVDEDQAAAVDVDVEQDQADIEGGLVDVDEDQDQADPGRQDRHRHRRPRRHRRQ